MTEGCPGGCRYSVSVLLLFTTRPRLVSLQAAAGARQSAIGLCVPKRWHSA